MLIRLYLIPCVLFAVGCSANKLPPVVPEWPDAAQVERMTAVVSGSVSGEPDLAEFDVPPTFVPAVVRAINPPLYNQHPPAKHLFEIGQLRINCFDGRTLDVRLIFFGKEPTLFSLNGVPCVRGGPYVDLGTKNAPKFLPEVLTVEGLLRGIHRKDKLAVEQYMAFLDQSAGREMLRAREP